MLYDIIYRAAVYPFIELKKGQRIVAGARQYQKALELPPKQQGDAGSRALHEVVVHAATTCPFWKERFRAASLDPHRVHSTADLKSLPLLEKSDVREYRESMLSSAIAPENRLPSMTGGSTAAPMWFCRDPACLSSRIYGEWAFHQWMGRAPYHRRALVWGAAQDLGRLQGVKAYVRTQILDRVIVLPGNQMTKHSLDRFIKKMQRFRPLFLHGYSQAIYLLAKQVRDRGADVSSLRATTVTAEPISEEQKAEIGETFGCPVYAFYGAREFGMMSAELPGCQGLHIDVTSVLVEFLRPDGTPAEPGTPGQIVVTDLLNRAMPLIRYRIGDVGIPLPADDPGGRGLPRMSLLAGRETDLLVTPASRFICGAALTLVSSPGIAQLQYHQAERSRVVVRYVKAVGFTGETLSHLQRQLDEVVGDGVEYEFVEVDQIPLAASGKCVYVHSEVSRKMFAVDRSGYGSISEARS